ncbi:MAG: AI-2E family transporter [Alphaproteobacteria bacterium]|nr:AI-2E family transporter [Alphaproteobacteria bacterium]
MNGLILFAGLILLLWIGSSIFIPLLVATFLWYLINATATYYRKILPATPRRHEIAVLFNIMSHIFSIATYVGLIYLFATRVRPMFVEILPAIPEIQDKMNIMWKYIDDTFGLDISGVAMPSIEKIVSNIGSSVAKLATSMGMVIVYMIFMFVEQSTFHKKLAELFPNKTQHKKMSFILNSIDENMKRYLFMKTLVSGITGIISYIWMYMLGLEFAGVWAFVIFILSYIPTIGAIISCILPILFAILTGATLNELVLLSLGLIGLQLLFGNIIEPKLTGKTLNLSTLAILINLVFWGLIWGVAGMFFSVPLLVATFIITAQFDSTRWIAVLLSADGKIPDKDED